MGPDLSRERATRRDTLLVVDDTPETLGFLTDTLDHEGFTVLIATDGESALDLVDHITPDLVLMDAVMPGMGGFEACRKLKREKLLVQPPVIFMTGLCETQDIVTGFAAGGVDYVTKPVVVDELLARIRAHLANARRAHESRQALDATGRFLVAIDRQGQLLWCTPQAGRLLSEIFPTECGRDPKLPSHLLRELLFHHRDGARDRKLEWTPVGSTGPDELLFRIAECGGDRDEQVLRRALALTAREAEVLLWISRGKSNRTVGDILTISPRTVNKHLEQIFEKLGVDNRASATAQAVRALA